MPEQNAFHILFSRSSVLLVSMVLLLSHGVQPSSVQLVGNNINNILATHEVVFVNFYANWCRFSQILAPVFEEAAEKVKELFPEPNKVAFGKVDCDAEAGIATTYHISKYPTLKLFRNGQIVKREYRGQRSMQALLDFIKGQVEDQIKTHPTMDELDELEDSKRNMIGYFQDKNTDAYKTYRRVSTQLRDDCVFRAAVGDIAASERVGGSDKIVFRPPNTRREDIVYQGDLTNYDFMVQWMQDKCVPLVREITFENAEELTEEGLPFLILFHKIEDREIVESFSRAVTSELLSEKTSINFLTADGAKFSHPLHHLGKTVNDLPVLAIDSFRHMYLFKHDVRQDLETPGLLKQFIADLHSGKLHREFHHGPDPVDQPPPPSQDAPPSPTKTPPPPPGSESENSKPDEGGHLPVTKDITPPQEPSAPPESSFKKLKPSETRYTILQRDEL